MPGFNFILILILRGKMSYSGYVPGRWPMIYIDPMSAGTVVDRYKADALVPCPQSFPTQQETKGEFIRELAQSHHMNWWLIFLHTLGCYQTKLATMYTSKGKHKIVADSRENMQA